MYIYIYEGYDKKSNVFTTERLIFDAMSQYIAEENVQIDSSWDFEIIRSENGKPYFKNAPFHFSVSHSGMLFICAISKDNIGIDIEVQRNIEYEKLANRFFNEIDSHYVALWGQEGYYQLWVVKEAIIKYMDGKLAHGLKDICVTNDGNMLDKIKIEKEEVYIGLIELIPEIKCAYATNGGDEICIRTLN